MNFSSVYVFVDEVSDMQSFEWAISQLIETELDIFYQLAKPTSVFAQDTAKTVTDENQNLKLLTPYGESSFIVKNKQKQITEALPTVQSQFFWEGGNILCDGVNCFVGAKTIAINSIRRRKVADVIVEALEQEFGYPVTILGDYIAAKDNITDPYSGQADFHIDLDVSILGKLNTNQHSTVLIADSEISKPLLDAVLERDALFYGHFLEPNRMREVYVESLYKTMAKRKPFLDMYERQLNDLGYICVKVPDFRLSPEFNLLGNRNTSFNYINGIPFSNADDEPSFYYFRYHFDELDAAFKEILESLNINPIAINSSNTSLSDELMFFRGGLHCIASKVA